MTKRIAKTPCDGGIYRITCTAGDVSKTYIGSTRQTFSRRWQGHRSALRNGCHHSRHFQNAWDKYGEQSFEFYVLEPVQFLEDLIDCEQKWIDIYQSHTRECGFNLAPRADGSCFSAETKAKIGRASTGRMPTAETRAKMSAAHAGKKKTPEHVAKVAIANTGKKRTPEQIARSTAVHIGRKQSPEEIANNLAARIKNNPFYHKATAPDGTVHDRILNLHAFCKGFGLDSSRMARVASGAEKHCRGWKCEKLRK